MFNPRPPEEKKKSSQLASRAMKISGMNSVNQSQRHLSFTGSQSRRSSILAGKSKMMDQSGNKQPRKTVRVLDDSGNDVTPQTMHQAEPGQPGVVDIQSEPGGLFLDEIFSSTGSDQLKSMSSFTVPFSRSSGLSESLFTEASLNKYTENSVLKLEMSINPAAPSEVPRKKDNVQQDVPEETLDEVQQHLTEEMLDEVITICFTETDTITLLDILPTLVSEDVDDAEAIKERNSDYVELCKNRMGNDKYVVRSMQTFNGAPKHKEIQSDKIVMVDAGTMATGWDIYDSFCGQNKKSQNEYPEGIVKTSKRPESSSTVGTGSTISSLSEMEMCGTSLNAEPDPQQIILSETFQHQLLVMERSIVANNFQPKLAAYRQLPVLADPECTVKPGTQEQGEEDEESSPTPTVEHLWAFSCELTRGRNITCMAWNKENLDLLAVGYGNYDSRNQKRGLICCWSIKNITWPERVFNCHSSVTSLDFSANNPDQLAVGMYDGSIAIYSVHSRNKTCVANSSACSHKHLQPVWQVNWTKQDMRLSGEERVEMLVSVSADGRITKWLCSTGLDCIDLMNLNRSQDSKKKTAGSEKKAAGSKKKTDQVLSSRTPGLCVDFHPTDSCIYLAGTWDGLIHKCSISNSQHFLDTYQKHFCPVNHIEWSPFSPDVFLSCSSDWTIQLWKQDHFTPVWGFATKQAVYTFRWSPNWSTVFAAINGQQMEVWDLNSSILDPIIVHRAAPGVKMTTLLFARGTNCILVGDSDGQVTVYELKHLSVGDDKQVDSLDDIVHSMSMKLQSSDTTM